MEIIAFLLDFGTVVDNGTSVPYERFAVAANPTLMRQSYRETMRRVGVTPDVELRKADT